MTHAELTTHYQLPDGAAPTDCTTELLCQWRGLEGDAWVTITQYHCPACGLVLLSNDSRGIIVRIWPATAEAS
jgi:hypothetical protein